MDRLQESKHARGQASARPPQSSLRPRTECTHAKRGVSSSPRGTGAMQQTTVRSHPPWRLFSRGGDFDFALQTKRAHQSPDGVELGPSAAAVLKPVVAPRVSRAMGAALAGDTGPAAPPPGLSAVGCDSGRVVSRQAQCAPYAAVAGARHPAPVQVRCPCKGSAQCTCQNPSLTAQTCTVSLPFVDGCWCPARPLHRGTTAVTVQVAEHGGGRGHRCCCSVAEAHGWVT